KAHIFSGVHVKLDDGKSFGHHLQSRMVVKRSFADHDTTGVDGQMIGQSFQFFPEIKNVFAVGVVLFRGQGFVHQNVDVHLGQTKYFTEFPDDGPSFEGVVGGEQGGALPAVPFENVIGDVVA